jgi:hypothetical protein
MSRRDNVFQAVNAVQNHVFEYIDSHQQPTGSNYYARPPPPRPNTSSAGLPLYGARPTAGEHVPHEVLYSAPGQAQRVADQLPMGRMARGDARDARRAAAALRKEQLKNGQLKKRHTFASGNGRIIMDIYSPPQKTLTYIGGSADRGTGAMKGKVIVHAQEGDRISAIRLKIKAVVRVAMPKSGTPQAPFQLDSADPSREPTSEREVLLLQLESKLYSTPSSALPVGSTSNDPTLLKAGTYEYPFSVDIPSSSGSKGLPLPPSFILTPSNVQSRGPAAKGSLFKIPILASDWASVKWYTKLTVERPGIFRPNDRIFAPFVYLPPPPRLNGIEAQLERRLKLVSEVDTALRRFSASNYTSFINLERFTESVSGWDDIPLKYGIGSAKNRRSNPPLATGQSNEEGPGFFSKLLFGSQVEGPAAVSKETWSLGIPRTPHIFPLRSGIPFVLHRAIEWRGQQPVNEEGLSKVPHVVLLQRTNVYNKVKGPISGTTVRYIADSRQTPATRPASISLYDPKGSGKSQLNRRVDSWLGMIDMPACTPCFETPVVSLDYFLSVRVGAGQSIEVLHSEPVVICCPTPRPAAVPRPSLPSRQSTSRTKPLSTPSRDSHKKQESPSPSSHRPGPAIYNAAASSSRPRPVAPAPHMTAVDEKRILHEQQHSQAVAAAVSVPSTPPPRHQETPIPSRTPSRAPSRAPSEADTNDDDEEDAYNEDELMDLPPSYHEVVGFRDED